MAELTNLLTSFARDAAWQSTAALAIGLLVARYGVRQPARRHAVLVLALIAAVAAPAASQLVRHRGWGMLGAEAAAAANQQAARHSESVASSSGTDSGTRKPSVLSNGAGVESSTESHDALVATLDDARRETVASQPGSSGDATAGQAAASLDSAATRGSRRPQRGNLAAGLFAAAWLVASLLVAVRLMRGVWAGVRLMREALPCREPAVAAALHAAQMRLGLERMAFEAFESDDVRCPVIWCWGRRPRVLLPVEAARCWTAAQWTGVLCHELPHYKRRDHWASLAAELVCCLLPWQPLAWWATRRLEQASELACDDWTVAAGYSPAEYADTLLSLAEQPGLALAMAALRHRSGLAGRIHHILTQAVPRPGSAGSGAWWCWRSAPPA